MGRKFFKKFIPFLTVFVILYSVFCPSLYQAATSEYLGGFNSGINTTYAFAPTSIGCINNSVVVYDDYYAGGTLYTQYTVFDAFVTIASVKCNNVYSAMRTYVSSFNFVPTNYSNMNGFQLAIGTWEEFQNGEYHTILAAAGITEMHLSGWDELSICDYGTGEEVYIGLVFNCYCPSTPGSISSVAASCSFSFSGTIKLYGYDFVGVYDYIYQMLGDIYYDQKDILAELESIDSSVTGITNKLTSLVNYVKDNYDQLVLLNNRINSLNSIVSAISSKLDSIQDELEDVNTELNTQTGILGSISSGISNFYDAFLEYTGLGSDKEAPSAPNTSGVSNQIQMEQQLLGKDTSDAVNNLNITVDMSANGFIWGFIDGALRSNSIVFGGFITLLSIGVIKLFLGR